MENTVMISSLLCNILIGCFCIVVLSWAVVAIQTVINDFKREKREEKKALQDDEIPRETYGSPEIMHVGWWRTLAASPF